MTDAAFIAQCAIAGNERRPGSYVSDWEEGEHPFGQPDPCPFCGRKLNYTEFEYNGPGSPPSYMVVCGNCGAQGPHSRGSGRGDHYGAMVDAVKQWNDRPDLERLSGGERL